MRKAIVGAVVVAAALAVAGWWLLAGPSGPARIELLGSTTAAEHPPGSSVAGITWRAPYTELRVAIRNPGATPYDQLDLLVRPDQLIAAISHDWAVAGVILSPEVERTLIVELEKESGEEYSLPLVLIATGAGYRVRVPQLPGRTTLELVIATVTMPPPGDADPPAEDPFDKAFRVWFDSGDGTYWYGHPEPPDVIFGPRAAPATVAIRGSYVVAGETHEVDVRLEVRDRAAQARVRQPLTLPIGVSLTTRRLMPARSVASTTSSMSL